jgi:hypothetical protein
LASREKRKRERRQRERREQRSRSAPKAAAVEQAKDAPEPKSPAHKSKDDLVRERLVPLDAGERPRAVTVGAFVAALLVVGWVAALVFGDSNVASAAPLALLLAVAAVGMWRARYWAVLGFQVLMALTLVNALLFLLLRADAALDFVVGLTIVAAGGALFWFLVKALARLQMPQRRTPTG